MRTALPIEVRVDDDLALRGHELDAVGPPVVLLHEPGRDLDAWRGVTRWLAGKGFKVIVLDLPGHGLSDGDADEVDPPLLAAIEEISRMFGPIGIAAAGGSCRLLPSLSRDDGVPVQVLISPESVDLSTLARSEWAIRLVMCGPGDRDAHAAAKLVFDRLRGEKMMITGGETEQGTDLVVGHRHLAEELVMWFRRYLTPYHLTWIAEVTGADPQDAPTNEPKEP